MIRMKNWLVLTVVMLSVMVAGCESDPVSPPSVVFPATNVSFNGHVKPVLLNNCALSGCHDGYSYSPSNPGTILFRLETHADVLSEPSLVLTLEPERSKLAMVLRGELLHPDDPYFRALNQSQIQGIIQWIREGALNN